MRFSFDNISGSYDERHDTIYIYKRGKDYSYGTEETDGIVVFKSIESDEITGIIIYDFKKRVNSNSLNVNNLPFKIDWTALFSFHLLTL